MSNKIILATSNVGKLKEFNALLGADICIPQKAFNISDADETGQTFIENALIKARHASKYANMPAIADDSGLVVPCLDGKPGIYSSRFAGESATDEENMQKLLRLLEPIAQNGEMPEAYFYCAIVLTQHAADPTPVFGTGILKGHIISKPCGAHGFGYDPIFYLKSHEATLATLGASVKNAMSHRARALEALAKQTEFIT